MRVHNLLKPAHLICHMYGVCSTQYAVCFCVYLCTSPREVTVTLHSTVVNDNASLYISSRDNSSLYLCGGN